jgi:tRNA(Arg) A34 adenosine deaminase TadA
MSDLALSPEMDEKWMRRCLQLAQNAAELGEVPIGAVLVCDDELVAEAFNRREADQNPLGHAEILVIEKASKKLGRWRLSDCTLYVTLEPCPMCAGALHQARIGRLVYGTPDPKAGAIESLYQMAGDSRLNHRYPVTQGVLSAECALVLKNFFAQLRKSAHSLEGSSEESEES